MSGRNILCLITVLSIWACTKGATPSLSINGNSMGTSYTVRIVSPGPEPVNALETSISRILTEVDARMSTWREDSELSEINRNPGQDWITVSAELYTVLSAAVETSRRTDGAFDITVGTLVNLWGFGPLTTAAKIPALTEVTAAMQLTGYQKLELRESPPAIRKPSGSYLDLSGIAKGYAVDRVATLLNDQGFTNYLVEIGGEIRARGLNQDGEPWRVGIEKPLVDRREAGRRIYLADMAMATSGDYRNFFESEGRRYSHIVDPRTGFPVAHDLASVTVIDKSTMIADALATALLVMGADDGFHYAEKNNIPVLFIVHNDDGFTEKYTVALSPFMLE